MTPSLGAADRPCCMICLVKLGHLWWLDTSRCQKNLEFRSSKFICYYRPDLADVARIATGRNLSCRLHITFLDAFSTFFISDSVDCPLVALSCPQVRVDAIVRHEFGVSALFRYLTIFENDDQVCKEKDGATSA